MRYMMRSRIHASYFMLPVCLLLISAACNVKWISNYDEQTDKAVSSLQKTVEGFFVNLENLNTAPECSYENQKAFYNNAKVEVSALKVRTDAIDKNKLTTDQVSLLSDSLEKLERLHQLKEPGGKCFTRKEIEPLRQNFNTIFTSILKLELAKKREVQKPTE